MRKTSILAPLLRGACALLATTLGAGWLTAADDVVAAARAAVGQPASAVVTLHAVVTLNISAGNGQKQKQTRKIEIHATCVDALGIFAASYTELIPGDRIQAMLDAQNRQMHAEVSTDQVTVEFADGTQKPADIVGQSRELDVVLVRLSDKAAGLAAVDLGSAVSTVQALDPVFVLGSGAKSEGHAPLAAVGRILGVVGGKRPFVLGDNTISGFTGCVVYAASGKPVGLEVYRALGDDAGDGHAIMPQADPGVVIRPATQLAALVHDAETAKPVAPSPTTGALPFQPVTP